MHALLGMPSSCTREQRRNGLQVGDLAGQPIRSLRQQASESPVVLLQPSVPDVMGKVWLQVDFDLFLMPSANDQFSLPAHKVVVMPLQLFRC